MWQFFDSFLRSFGSDLAIDMGTANTLINFGGKGVIVREPTVVARRKKTKELIAVGSEAKKMLGKNPEMIEVIKPLVDGVIADFDATTAMLKHYFDEIQANSGLLNKLVRPRVIFGIPCGVTEVEKRAVQDAALSAGARQAWLVEEPLAAAIGAGIDVTKPEGQMLIDIGGGTTEIAVISLSGIVVYRSLRVAGEEMNQAIINAVRLSHGLYLGESTAEEVKINIGSASAMTKEKMYVVRGRDMGKGLPRSLKLKSVEIREILSPVVTEIVTGVGDVLEETPPELLADILKHGIILSGGGSQLYGIDKVIAEATKMPAGITDSPQDAVVKGLTKLTQDSQLLESLRLKRGLK